MIEIDRNKIYESHGYRFKNFVCLSDEEKRMVLEWRNSPDVRKWMYNKDIIKLEDHLRFIEQLENKDDRYYWLVLSPSGDYIGVYDITSVDREKDFAEAGYYLNPSPEYLGEGLPFVKECLCFFFFVLSIGNTYGAVDKNNVNAYIMSKYLGAIYMEEKDNYFITRAYDKELFKKRYNESSLDFITYFKKEKKLFK